MTYDNGKGAEANNGIRDGTKLSRRANADLIPSLLQNWLFNSLNKHL